MADTTNKSDPKDSTPPKWSGPEDARSKKGSGKYPYYYTTRTRSGHVLTLDDSEGHESVTLQHRGGSMVQFMPDGAVQFVAQNGQYTFVFGENRVKITGAYDVTVEGAASMRVKGDYNTTVMGNHNMTVNGDYNMTAKNFNAQVRGDMDISAKSFTAKMEGSTEISSHGITSIGGDGGVSLTSTQQSVAIGASKDVAINSKGGKTMIEAGTSLDIRSEDNMAVESRNGEMAIKSADLLALSTASDLTLKSSATVGIDGGPNIRMNEGLAQQATGARKAVAILPKPTSPNREA
jgi:hypothetical protein